MKYIFEVIFLALIYVLADLQAGLIKDNRPINHVLWGSIFAAIIVFGWAFEDRDYWFLAALVLEHFVFFSIALNFLRDPRKPFFYISSVGKQGSTWDKLFLKIQPAYPYIWGAGLIGFILLNIFKL